MSGALRRFAQRWFGVSTLERIVNPLLADFEAEDRRAAESGARQKRRWLRAAYGVAFVKVLCLCAIRDLVEAPSSLTPDDRRALWRSALLTVAASAVVVALLVVPPLVQQRELLAAAVSPRHGAWNAWIVLMTYLVPQGAAIALPAGLLVGILAGVWGRLAMRRVGTVILVASGLCCIAAFVNLAWIIPASNQAFRAYVFGQDVTRGIPELTLGELHRLLTPGSHSPVAVEWPHDMPLIAWSYHMRLVLAVAPLVLALCALATIVRSRGRVAKVVVPVAVFAFYYAGLYTSRSWVFGHVMSAPVAVWTPSVVVALASLAALLTRGAATSGQDLKDARSW